MKIVYLHQYFTTPDGPGGTRSYEFARQLVLAGHEVHMVCSDRQGRWQDARWHQEDVDGITVHWLHVPYDNKMSFRRRIVAFASFAMRSARKARALRADLIFATSTPLTIAIPGIYAKLFRHTPMVFEVRDLWPLLPIAMGALNNTLLQKAARLLEHVAYRNSTQIVALSPGMRDGVVATGYPAQKVHVIPNSADIELFQVDASIGTAWRQQFSWLQDRHMVLYCGTLGYINGVSYLAELAAKMLSIDPEIRFLVVGAGVEEDKIRSRAIELGVWERNFFVLPPVAKKDVPAIFSAATVSTSLFLPLPEMKANSANKFFDTLAAAKPIAINYSGWQAEIIEKHRAGIQLDAHDLNVAVKALHELLHNPERLQQAGQAAALLAQTQFSREQLAAQFRAVLESATPSHVIRQTSTVKDTK